MKLHELKILPKFYEKVTSGEKRFEIIYKLDGGNYGLEKGYCILSIKPYRTDTYLGLTR